MAYIRYQTVRDLLIGGALGAGITALIFAASADPEPVQPVASQRVAIPKRAPSQPLKTPEPVTTKAPETAKAPEPAATKPAADPLAKVADTILHQKATSSKIKDLFRGSGPKVNIYDDNNDGQWDRAKVDYDRDDVDDDKLTFKAGILEKKNVKSGEITVWKDDHWEAK